ncbi:predicted protein [Botrytis cinerea T4]|uniref:Uncharacterized protein n=1 Tax=Botryotinia fuckeliana (strain T4) TaxID=999810 RepID=G2YEN2_BOTF4|nr:predicted protein [Botrytis cinerea T4]
MGRDIIVCNVQYLRNVYKNDKTNNNNTEEQNHKQNHKHEDTVRYTRKI